MRKWQRCFSLKKPHLIRCNNSRGGCPLSSQKMMTTTMTTTTIIMIIISEKGLTMYDTSETKSCAAKFQI